jgi:hypothetical protein
VFINVSVGAQKLLPETRQKGDGVAAGQKKTEARIMRIIGLSFC